MTKYDIDAINGCMQKALDYKPKFGEISDTFPELCTASTVYGKLPSSAGLASAVDALNDLMHDELNAAEDRLNGVAGALDAVAQTVQNNEDEGVRTYGAQPRYVQV
ncbi:hypothetical protein [Actinophytocola algeriensis]|uniref:Excreted virulence factor EspC (Type VII ESX diderm) n=1 Tax=Actinophytocola algeriensis TaxID=1768010 RepID=A0A7W7Q472_9PSEU|nr:hypothetical protein [Actinophytocola algeriensis]MBB4906528.1 hypothetical protein [Actinophytocola algeriensis]MBE1478009.1 hypothetical protein [Actinophytocola algeriensis]